MSDLEVTEEIIIEYGEIPTEVADAPETHELEEAILGTLEEDMDVNIDETSN